MNILSELTHKSCSICGKSKSVYCFGKRTASKDGLRAECKECRVKSSAKYYLENSEKIKADVKKYRLADHERYIAAARKYRLNNKEKLRIKSKKYQSNNPKIHALSSKKYQLANKEKYRDYANTRRARKISNGVYEISTKELNKLYKSSCFYCGSNNSIQADHIIPISKGGQHSIGNLVPACAKCNNSKKDKFLIEWKRFK